MQGFLEAFADWGWAWWLIGLLGFMVFFGSDR